MSINDRAARVLSRIPSVFHRLVVSYVILVALVAATVSGVSYLYFKDVFNKELYGFHLLYLKNIEKELSSQVLDASTIVYQELDSLLSQRSEELLAPEEGLPGQASKVYSSYRILNDIAAHYYEKIEGVHLYYVQSGLLVSSSGFQADEDSALRGGGKRWLSDLLASGGHSAWTVYERPAYFGVPAMRLFRSYRCYPILSNAEDCSVVVCVDFRAEALRGIMARLAPAEGGRTALMSRSSGAYIGSQADPPWDAETEASLREAVAGGAAGGSGAAVSLKGGSELLSVLPLEDSGWYLVNLVRASQLYRKGDAIRLAILAICALAIGLGALAAFFAATGIYNPLALLVGRLRSLSGVELPEPGARTDEYRVIGEALSGISSRMGELEATVDANKPIIKHELVLRFLEGERIEADELRGVLGLLGSTAPPGRLRAVLLTIDLSAMDGGDWAGEGGRVLKYRVADELERDAEGIVLASALSGERIAVIASSALDPAGEVARLELWSALALTRAGARVRAAAGSLVASPEELTDSFAVASELAEYHFLFPELPILLDRPELLARSGRSAMPERGFVESLGSSLQARDLGRFRSMLERYRVEARSGDCRARACRAELERLGLAVADFARGLGQPGRSSLERSVVELLAESPSVDAYLDELLGIASELCAGAEDPHQLRNALLVARIKAYVAANLGGDLSLDRVGEAVAVSPGYMGKVFKQETGRGFVAYVSEARLGEAARLLVESRDCIQEIGRKVGFNTPAYFIRLFKGRYGQTPLDFRRSKAGPGPSEG